MHPPPDPRKESYRRVHSAWSLFEARLVLEALRSDGIESHIRNEALVGSVGMLPPSQAKVEVWVNVDDYDESAALVHKVLFGDAHGPVVGQRRNGDDENALPTPSECPSCGAPWEPGFDTCWKCCHRLGDA